MKNFINRIFFNLFYLFLDPPWDTGISPPELKRFIQNHPPGRALDLGCGTGTNAITLAKNGWDVTGVDFVHNAIKQAKQKAKKEGVQVEFHVSDVTNLDEISPAFNLILDIGCFHSLPKASQESYIQNLERLLASDGTFLMYAFLEDPSESSNSSSNGLTDQQLSKLANHFQFDLREDGTERGKRPSAWFWYKK